MPNSNKITRELVAGQPWGEAFLREMDLVIAVNTLESLRSGKTLYNSDLNQRVAERCASLDGGLDERQTDLVRIPPNPEAEWKREPDALVPLKGLPRGHWAVFEKDGGYGAYMSDGYGGIGTESGYKFAKNSPNARDFNFTALYACVLSYMVYLRRHEIENEILEHSFRVAGIEKGRIFEDLWLNSKRYGKVELIEVKEGYYVGNGDAVEVKATRRGVKPSHFVLPIASFARTAGIEPVLPPEYEDTENDARLVSDFRKAEPTADESETVRFTI